MAEKRPGFHGIGCGTVLAIALGAILGYFFVYPAVTPTRIRGDLVDAALVTLKNGSTRLWILTDGSFSYIQTTQSPGRFSTGRRCLSCKTWLYVYDPAAGRVLRKTKIPRDDIVILTSLAPAGDGVYLVSDAYGKGAPGVTTWDPDTGAARGDTAGFISRYPELSGGIIKAQYFRKDDLISLDTRDGRKGLTYSLKERKLYPSYSAYLLEKDRDTAGTSMLSLVSDSSGEARRLLYLITGPRGRLHRKAQDVWSASDIENLEHYRDGGAAKKLSDKIFLEGTIYYADDECAIIVHLDQAGKKAGRILTCMAADGTVKWSVPPRELFEDMKIDEEDDPFSGLTFTRDRIGVMRSGNLVVLKLQGVGLMVFDHATGKKLSTLEI
jgi:hypothetical protein